jgi:peptidoglycan/xylan/chitin deacetylase (PgdA/CDA1 family)
MQQMQADGHEIDAHTRTHPHLTWLSHDDMVSEVAGSKSDLEALGMSPVTFAYPFNDFNDDVEQAVKDAGFQGARSARQGFNNRYTDPFALLDQHVESSVTIDQVQGWIDQAIADKTWLILEVHDVDESGSQYSITPEMLDQIIAYVQSSGISVVTNSQGLTAMGT